MADGQGDEALSSKEALSRTEGVGQPSDAHLASLVEPVQEEIFFYGEFLDAVRADRIGSGAFRYGNHALQSVHRRRGDKYDAPHAETFADIEEFQRGEDVLGQLASDVDVLVARHRA